MRAPRSVLFAVLLLLPAVRAAVALPAPVSAVAAVSTIAAIDAAPVAAETRAVRGRVVDPSGLPLPGVDVTVTSADATGASSALPAVTGEDGTFTIPVLPGRYRLQLQLSGFEPAVREVVVDDRVDPAPIDVTLTLAHVEQDVTVVASLQDSLMSDARPDAPATISREVIDNAMLPNSQFDDVLPLMPNVLRGPDGLISVAGARAPQSALFVNGVNLTDPISGAATTMLPIDAVDAMQVYSGGYPADLGRATGGITAVRTRSGDDRLRFSSDSMLPRLNYTEHGVDGVAYWEPNVGVSGPVVPGRLWFEQAVSYRFDRNRYTTVLGPDQNLFKTVMSWSQLDAQLSPAQHLRLAVAADPQTNNHANITAFTPAATTPQVDQGGWSASLADAATRGAITLETHLAIQRTQMSVTPEGAAPSVMAHDVFRGDYYDTNHRQGQRVEAGAALTAAVTATHALMVGASWDRASLDASYLSAPVSMLRSDESVVRTIAFGPATPVRVDADEWALYAHDTWTAASWLTIDAALRYDRFDNPGAATWSPRVSWSVKKSPESTITGSVGLFGDKMPLTALAFADLPSRLVDTYAAGAAADAASPVADGSALAMSPAEYVNVVDDPLRLARALRWNVEFDRHVGDVWTLRARYEERHGSRELVVNPLAIDSGLNALVLSSDGESLARSLETTVGYRADRRAEAYVSYVRAIAHGNQNSLDAIESTFRAPFIQPDQIGRLPVDVPNRILIWGLAHLPSQITVAPFLEMRNGFPFTAIDDNWINVGDPNAFRLPWFSSLDLSVNKIVALPHGLPDARVGFKLYNIASTHTEREVQRDLERADFGASYNPIPRDFAFVFEFLWGHRH